MKSGCKMIQLIKVDIRVGSSQSSFSLFHNSDKGFKPLINSHLFHLCFERQVKLFKPLVLLTLLSLKKGKVALLWSLLQWKPETILCCCVLWWVMLFWKKWEHLIFYSSEVELIQENSRHRRVWSGYFLKVFTDWRVHIWNRRGLEGADPGRKDST